jgi:hypothetical protein
MAVDAELLDVALRARERVIELQHERELAQVDYQHAIRRLHAGGASMREVADALGLSYQRVHQVVDVSTGKGALRHAKPPMHCSFCGLDESADACVIAGPSVFICDRCADLARNVLHDHAARSNERTSLVCLSEHEGKARCDFCGKRHGDAHAMIEAPHRPRAGKLRARRPGVRICGDCLQLCREILDQPLSPA